MNSPDLSFTELVRRAREGDKLALTELARTYESDLRIAARIHLGPALRPYLDTMDLVQSIHHSLMLGLQNNKFEFADSRSLIALAMKMVRRKIAHQWRRHRRQVRSVGATSLDRPEDLLATLQCRRENPASEVELRDAIVRLWLELDDDDRELMELRLQGFSSAEAAKKTGKSPSAVRTRLHRLRKRLHDEHLLTEWL
jgi:RNA polymerase sigma factor (sigma-70 family)